MLTRSGHLKAGLSSVLYFPLWYIVVKGFGKILRSPQHWEVHFTEPGVSALLPVCIVAHPCVIVRLPAATTQIHFIEVTNTFQTIKQICITSKTSKTLKGKFSFGALIKLIKPEDSGQKGFFRCKDDCNLLQNVRQDSIFHFLRWVKHLRGHESHSTTIKMDVWWTEQHNMIPTITICSSQISRLTATGIYTIWDTPAATGVISYQHVMSHWGWLHSKACVHTSKKTTAYLKNRGWCVMLLSCSTFLLSLWSCSILCFCSSAPSVFPSSKSLDRKDKRREFRIRDEKNLVLLRCSHCPWVLV